MMKREQKAIHLFLALAILAAALPACSSASREPSRSMDEALLLALSSHEQLELGGVEQVSGRLGDALFGRIVPAAEYDAKSNPHTQMAAIYARFAQSQPQGSAAYTHFTAKAEEYALLAQALDDARAQRARRRGRGFQRFFRNLVRAPIRVPRVVARTVGKLLKGSFRVAGTVIAIAVEQAPRIARDIVKQKLRELRDLAQGKIDLTWDKVAARLGAPFAVWLRSKIDPAFVRLRDRIVARAVGKKPPPQSTEEESGVSNEDEDVGYEGEGGYDTPAPADIAYGNHKVVVGDQGDYWGYFTWTDYWTNLPGDSRGDDCQPAGQPTGDAEAYLDGYEMEMTFELDSGQLKGNFSHEGTYELAYQETAWTLSGHIEDGWVRPAADASGWEFGGTVVAEVTMHDRWRCFRCVPDGEGFCEDVFEVWLEDEKSMEVEATLEGWTEQVVPGEEDEPDRLMPGGEYSFRLFYEGADADMQLYCDNCTLPADFPPPVYFEE